MKLLLVISGLFVFCSCHRSIRPQPSILEAYEKYQVLMKVKSELRGNHSYQDNQDALIAFAEELAPKDAELKLIKARALLDKGEVVSSKLVLEEAIELAPSYSAAWSAYGELLIANGFLEEGRNYCAYAVRLNPIDMRGRKCSHK